MSIEKYVQKIYNYIGQKVRKIKNTHGGLRNEQYYKLSKTEDCQSS